MRLLRRIMSAELIPIRVNQVAKLDRPSNCFKCQEGPHHRVLECVFRVLAILGYTVDGV